MTQSPGMSELIEAAERLRSIECGPGYARAVMDAYGQRPEGQLYDDLGTVTASVPTLLDDLAAAQGEIAAAIERIRELSLDYQREYDGRQAAQARADRMEGALREVANLGEIVAKSYVDEHKPDTLRDPKTGEEVTGLIAETVVALIQTVIALGDRARSALTLKSEKEMGLSRDLRPQPVASEPKNSDVQQVKP